jgi:hypothetical protein
MGFKRRSIWVFFLVQSLALWNIHNNLTIEKKVLNHPADIIYKNVIFLEFWSLKFKAMEKQNLNWMARELR